MLEVKNLTKIYKPKKGMRVTALDSVSFELPETGMIFLLGKSGSGKSTLLNLLGGLDSYTSGEIIIKGKSSKDFKGSDFDSYRNTFVGFVFQEFNILEEYSVGKNIAIALELQHKKADWNTIASVMGAVDLEKSYLDRNPGELSGGQKQRVAIARALVKNPDILMADEPTGALDSKTGKQVFDTLKKLSKEKLVIVVSHDKENAEIYGDRIIELADGKIIDDRMRKEGEGGETGFSFVPTEKEKIQLKEYAPGDFALIKSKLPVKDSFKLGVSGLKFKKIRLAFTIILSFIAFTVFGLCVTCAVFDSYKSEFETAKMNGEKTLLAAFSFGEKFKTSRPIYDQMCAGFTDEQLAEIERITGNKTLKLYEKTRKSLYSFDLSENFITPPDKIYYATKFANLLEVPDITAANLVPAAQGSRLPAEGNYTEIAISDWVADSFVKYGLKSNYINKNIKSYEDLLNETIRIQSNFDLKITGVFKTDINKENYAPYRAKPSANLADTIVLDGINKTVMSMGYVAPGFEFQVSPNSDMTEFWLARWNFEIGDGEALKINFADKIEILNGENIYTGGRELSTLEDDEIIINPYILNDDFFAVEEMKTYFDKMSEKEKQLTGYFNRVKTGQYRIGGILLKKSSSRTIYFSDTAYNLVYEKSGSNTEMEYLNSFAVMKKNSGQWNYVNKFWKASDYDLSKMNIYWGKNGEAKTELKENEVILYAQLVHGYENYDWPASACEDEFDKMEKDLTFGLLKHNNTTRKDQIVNGADFKVVGIYFDDEYWASLFSDEAYSAATARVNGPDSLIIKLSDNWKKNRELFDYLDSTKKEDNGIYAKIKPFTTATGVFDIVDEYTAYFLRILIYISIGLSVFAGLLLMNFISLSIANKKKEIGILRAIGAKSADVFKIFLSESLVIGAINFILSYTAVVILSVAVNKYFTFSVLVPGFLPALLIGALSLGVVLLATFIPIYKFAKKKPIDAINNR